MSLLEEIVNIVIDYRYRKLELSSTFVFMVKELAKALSEIDTSTIADMITSANSIKRAAEEKVEAEKKEEQTQEISDNLQKLMDKFKVKTINK